ncbi:MAG: shikimate dehydrogenase [Nitrospiria bacterium]
MPPSKSSKIKKVFGIFGNPIAHTLSPLMHQTAFETLGLPYTYVPFKVQNHALEQATRSLAALGISGINVTIPHKKNIIPFLDEITPTASKIGAVNTIDNRSGRLIGHNTDGAGFIASLREQGVDPAGMVVFLIGAGGAARGVAVALLAAGVKKMVIQVRNINRGRYLADHLSAHFSDVEMTVKQMAFGKNEPIQTKGKILLINTTPLGMKPDDPLPFDSSFIHTGWVVADLIYRPYETALLLAAKKRGATTVPGLGMLLYQGALAFKIWTKEKPPIEAMRQSLLSAFSDSD